MREIKSNRTYAIRFYVYGYYRRYPAGVLPVPPFVRLRRLCAPVTDGRLGRRTTIVLGFSFTKTDKKGPTRQGRVQHAQVIESVA